MFPLAVQGDAGRSEGRAVEGDGSQARGAANGDAPSTSAPSSASMSRRDVAGRQIVFDLVVAGRPDAAAGEVTRLYTRGPLDADPGLDFRLKVGCLV